MPVFDPSRQLQTVMQLRRMREQATERERARDRQGFNQVVEIASSGNPKLIERLGNLRGLPAAQVEFGKELAKHIKSQQERPSVGQEQQLSAGLAEAELSQNPRENVVAGLRGLEALEKQGVLTPAGSNRIAAGGGAQASEIRGEARRERSEGMRERIADREDFLFEKQFADETSRIAWELTNDQTLTGQPLTDTGRRIRSARLQSKLSGDSRLIDLGNGQFLAEGPSAIRASQTMGLEEDLIRGTSLESDLSDMIGLIEENASRAGGLGAIKRTATGIAGVIRDIAEQSPGVIGGIAQDTFSRIEDHVSRGRASPKLGSRAEDFLDDAAQGNLEALQFFVLYNVADQLKSSGRLSNQDIERARNAIGLTKGASADRVLASLKRVLERTRRKNRTLKRRLERAGAVTINPQDFSGGGEGERGSGRSIDVPPSSIENLPSGEGGHLDFRVTPEGGVERVR